jgi:Cu(I)/Ag(I) efflux system membrane fusion protein
VFKGTVQALLPDINQNTRTRKARVELANPGAALAPGMFVSVALSANTASRGESRPMVPTEAIIQTGRRTVVLLAEADGTFRPVDVEIGMEANGQTEIKRGLEAGQKVVASGQFLIDSEASLRATTTRMSEMPAGASASGVEHKSEGTVEAVRKDAVTLSHGPIPSLQWGAMTMDFAAPASGLPTPLKPGQSVRFAFTMNKDGVPVLTRIEPAKPATPQPSTDQAAAEKKR